MSTAQPSFLQRGPPTAFYSVLLGGSAAGLCCIFIPTLLFPRGEGATGCPDSWNCSAVTWPPLSPSAQRHRGRPLLSPAKLAVLQPRQSPLSPRNVQQTQLSPSSSKHVPQTEIKHDNLTTYTETNSFLSKLPSVLEQNEGQEISIQYPSLPWCESINVLGELFAQHRI